MIKFRLHRGLLNDSMATVRTVASKTDIMAILLIDELPVMSMGLIPVSAMRISYYGYDARIDWDTWIITLDGYGVIGFTNGEVK
jgi:hypothetical protein